MTIVYGFKAYGVYEQNVETSQTLLAHDGGRDANMDLIVQKAKTEVERNGTKDNLPEQLGQSEQAHR